MRRRDGIPVKHRGGCIERPKIGEISDFGFRISDFRAPRLSPHRALALALGLFVCLMIPILGQAAEAGEVVIAVVRDGPPPGEDIPF